MESTIRHIYVALIDRGGDEWRQVDAMPEGEDAYRIISENDHPDERWEYDTGTVVRCRAAALPSGERVLVATERLNPGRIGVHPVPRPFEGGTGASGW